MRVWNKEEISTTNTCCSNAVIKKMLSKDECCKDEFKKLLKINTEFCFAVLSTKPRASRMLDKCPILNYILKYSELYFSPFYDSDITNFFLPKSMASCFQDYANYGYI